MLEEALPISVSHQTTKTPKEFLTIHQKDLSSRDELTKEEKRRARQQKKRKIHTHLVHKATTLKEKRRAEGMAQQDRFQQRQLEKGKALQKIKNSAKEGLVDPALLKDTVAKGSMKSAKFFSKMNSLVKEDKAKKEWKQEHKGQILHSHGSTRKFKI